MGISVNAIIVVLMYAIGINYILLQMAFLNIGVSCPAIIDTYNQSDLAVGFTNLISIGLGRCDGLPFFLVIILEIPVIAGLFYIARAYVGAT